MKNTVPYLFVFIYAKVASAYPRTGFVNTLQRPLTNSRGLPSMTSDTFEK
jgi:hypothetical protein